eukprot:1188804-Prorocentrum_minimum.AAC.1
MGPPVPITARMHLTPQRPYFWRAQVRDARVRIRAPPGAGRAAECEGGGGGAGQGHATAPGRAHDQKYPPADVRVGRARREEAAQGGYA